MKRSIRPDPLIVHHRGEVPPGGVLQLPMLPSGELDVMDQSLASSVGTPVSLNQNNFDHSVLKDLSSSLTPRALLTRLESGVSVPGASTSQASSTKMSPSGNASIHLGEVVAADSERSDDSRTATPLSPRRKQVADDSSCSSELGDTVTLSIGSSIPSPLASRTRSKQESGSRVSGSSDTTTSSHSSSSSDEDEGKKLESYNWITLSNPLCGFSPRSTPPPRAVTTTPRSPHMSKTTGSHPGTPPVVHNRGSYSGSSSLNCSMEFATHSPRAQPAPGSILMKRTQLTPTPLPPLTSADFLTPHPSLMKLAPYLERCWLHAMKDGEWEKVEGHIAIQPVPFAQGSMRCAYYALEARSLQGSTPSTHSPRSPTKRQAADGPTLWVAKRYKKTSVDSEQYFADVEMHSISRHYAAKFNALGPPKPIEFIPAVVLELLPHLQVNGQSSSQEPSPGLLFALEPYLGDMDVADSTSEPPEVRSPSVRWVKHNNNDGYVNNKSYRCTPQAFSHYTLSVSEGRQLVCDLQGVGDFCTDPQILTNTGSGFGRGNLGIKSIQHFEKSHVCNSICNQLRLQPLNNQSQQPPPAPPVPTPAPPVPAPSAAVVPAVPAAKQKNASPWSQLGSVLKGLKLKFSVWKGTSSKPAPPSSQQLVARVVAPTAPTAELATTPRPGKDEVASRQRRQLRIATALKSLELDVSRGKSSL